ncbi:hypothetical protein [Saccharopolyspora mangrovi]|uniref:Uncharacterized protein n=1 Tax=Saccharopolyspora mangrovi TaxID=3082379 RepID=A0ABU6AD13_9PSEU|nr:hypothetical protein [Saccharopolyspora sp. S2-29]MEB3369410.1 hypothetical protein [Saccharopolyspora sp. S2-29]
MRNGVHRRDIPLGVGILHSDRCRSCSTGAEPGGEQETENIIDYGSFSQCHCASLLAPPALRAPQLGEFRWHTPVVFVPASGQPEKDWSGARPDMHFRIDLNCSQLVFIGIGGVGRESTTRIVPNTQSPLWSS